MKNRLLGSRRLLWVALSAMAGALITLPLACSQVARHQDTAKPCIECHAEDLSRAGGLDHTQQGFPTDCTECHPSQDQWKPVSFDHKAFPLEGKHAETPCDKCHDKDPVPTACVDCHEADRSRPTFPDHLAAGFETDCSVCHTPAGWDTYPHTAFPLDGKHAALPCSSCHDKDPLPNTCVGCHEADRSRPTTTDHRAPGFNTDCSACHTTEGWDQVNVSCNACHGSAASDAPPTSLGGSSATTDRGVGAHQAHLASSTWHAAVSCNACHLVPQSSSDVGHMDTALPAETTFTGVAILGGTSPAWDGSTCSGTYCHGATLDGGFHTAPVWTQVDGSQSTCHSCHGFPPAGGHPAGTTCGDCHGEVVDSTNAFIAPERHINGMVDVNGGATHPSGWSASTVHGPAFLSGPEGCKSCHGADLTGGSASSCEGCHSGWQSDCTFCHGGAFNNAPPESVAGDSSTSVRGVGAHQSHLASSTWRSSVSCSNCHTVPQALFDAGHIDTPQPAETTFTGISTADGATPAWGGSSCSGTYCHGATRNGGAHTAPVWTQVDGSQVTCQSCHGQPPAGGHTSNTNCSECHSEVVNNFGVIIAPDRHIDGTVDVIAGVSHPVGWSASTVHGPAFLAGPNGCKSCHGSDLKGGSARSCEGCHSNWQNNCTFCHGGQDNSTGAPPQGVDGESSTSASAVGRHTSHVEDGATHGAYGCGTCHSIPTNALSSGHVDPSPAELNFSGLAAGASYNPVSNQCQSVYCHGNGKTGSTGQASWTGSLSGGCSACHDDESGGSNMTLSGRHKKHIDDEGYSCSTCHGCVVNSSKVITDTVAHVNGSRDVCVTFWNSGSRSCSSNSCHGSENW